MILTSLYTVDTAIEVGISNFPVATNGTSAEDEPLLKDMMNFCLEGGTSTIDLAGAKARFADADIASLERSAIKLASSLCSVRQTGTCCQPPRFSEHGKRVLISMVLCRCFDTLVIKGTLQAVPNHTGTYLVSVPPHCLASRKP